MTELSSVAKDVLMAQAKLLCLEEWSGVNDPPCHPSDNEWHGCGTCVHRQGVAAILRSIEKSLRYVDDYGNCYVDSNQLLAIADELSGNTSGEE